MDNKIGIEYLKLFSSPTGKVVLEDLKKKVSLIEPLLPDFGSPSKLFYVEGRRDLVREIISTITYFETNKD